MTECEAAYLYGKCLGRLDTVITIMKLKINNEELVSTMNKIISELASIDSDMEYVCASEDNEEDKHKEMEYLFEEMAHLDIKFSQVLKVVEETTGIASLF